VLAATSATTIKRSNGIKTPRKRSPCPQTGFSSMAKIAPFANPAHRSGPIEAPAGPA